MPLQQCLSTLPPLPLSRSPPPTHTHLPPMQQRHACDDVQAVWRYAVGCAAARPITHRASPPAEPPWESVCPWPHPINPPFALSASCPLQTPAVPFEDTRLRRIRRDFGAGSGAGGPGVSRGRRCGDDDGGCRGRHAGGSALLHGHERLGGHYKAGPPAPKAEHVPVVAPRPGVLYSGALSAAPCSCAEAGPPSVRGGGRGGGVQGSF